MKRNRQPSRFSEWLDQQLRLPGVDPSAVAATCQTSVRYLSLLRRGWRSPTEQLARRISNALNQQLPEDILGTLAEKRGRRPKDYAPVEATVEAIFQVLRAKPKLMSEFIRLAAQTKDPYLQAVGAAVAEICWSRWLELKDDAHMRRAANFALRGGFLQADAVSGNRGRRDRAAKQAPTILDVPFCPNLDDKLYVNAIKTLAEIPEDQLVDTFEKRFPEIADTTQRVEKSDSPAPPDA
jgi:hypothetical protein